LIDDFEGFVVLQGFTSDVQGQIVGVDDSHDEGNVSGNEFCVLFGNEDASDVEFKIVFASVIVVEEIDGCSVGYVEYGGEHDLSVSVEVDPVHGRVGLFTDAFVEIDVVLFVDIVLISQPESFVFVDLLPLVDCSFDFFSFWFVCFLFDFEVVFCGFGCFYFDFFLDLFFVIEVDGEINEF